MDFKIKRTKPITKQLGEKYGGKWRHIPFQGMWICEELNLSAWYTADGGYDVNGEYQPISPIFRCLQGLHVYGLKDGSEKFYPE